LQPQFLGKKNIFMDAISYKTNMATANNLQKEWVVVDATDVPLGRLASQVAKIVRGKHKPTYTPHLNVGDHVVVVNAEKVRFTGNKMSEKQYVRYTGYPGGQRFATPEEVLRKKPVFIIETAVRGMLPKNRLGRDLFHNLHVVEGASHKFEAQKPKALNINELI
jgi:large subunit ribosomal protein L13